VDDEIISKMKNQLRDEIISLMSKKLKNIKHEKSKKKFLCFWQISIIAVKRINRGSK